jgi:hypothetical protein
LARLGAVFLNHCSKTVCKRKEMNSNSMQKQFRKTKL